MTIMQDVMGAMREQMLMGALRTQTAARPIDRETSERLTGPEATGTGNVNDQRWPGVPVDGGEQPAEPERRQAIPTNMNAGAVLRDVASGRRRTRKREVETVVETPEERKQQVVSWCSFYGRVCITLHTDINFTALKIH